MDSMIIDLSVKDVGILRITVLREGGTLVVVGSDDLQPNIRKLVFRVAEDAFKKRDAIATKNAIDCSYLKGG